MKNVVAKVFAGACALMMIAFLSPAALGQTSEVKEKPPMYSYVGNWVIPRTQWAEMDKQTQADQKTLQAAMAKGTIVAYGDDTNLVHQPDTQTHDGWWSAMSMAGVLDVLEQFYQNGQATTPVLDGATKHWDQIFVSRYYNWHSGSFKNGYSFVGEYKLKKHAPDDAVATLSKSVVVPLLEKLLADGTLHEYEVDTQAIHTESPDTFWIVYIAAGTDGWDKVNAALRNSMKDNPLAGPAFDSMVDYSEHRDGLSRTNATYK